MLIGRTAMHESFEFSATFFVIPRSIVELRLPKCPEITQCVDHVSDVTSKVSTESLRALLFVSFPRRTHMCMFQQDGLARNFHL